jgi:ATP-dependent helicase/DNAse subunit B
LAWEATRETIRTRLHHFLEKDYEELRDSGLFPTYFETETEGLLGDVLPGELALFRGRIDRIDIGEHEGKVLYRVVDYKTGGPSRRSLKAETAILRGAWLQLPIYLGLAKGWLEKKLGKPTEPLEAAFYNLADWERGLDSPSIDASFWQRCGQMFHENIRGLMEIVKKGHFYIRPSEDNDYCSWCDYAQICRKEHKPTVARSEKDPVRQANDQRLSRKAP